jgi:ketosteroid isomerase-like protein
MLIQRKRISATAPAIVHAAISCACLWFVVFASGCGESAPKDTRAADETTIRNLDAQWSKSAAAKDVDATVGYYSDDASLLAPNAPIASDKASIRAAWSGLLNSDTNLSWQADKVDVARSSDMAYIVGAYLLTSKDPQGRPTTDRGKFVEVWKKQADGTWKVAADIFNSDLAAQTPGPAAANKSGRHPHAKKRGRHSRSTGAQ